MPQFWQIDATRWINPAHIVYVEDSPDSSLPSLYVTMVAVTSGLRRTGHEEYTLALQGESREAFLAYLARETEAPPPPPSA